MKSPAVVAMPGLRAGRLLGALPDALTGVACMVVWIAPFAFG